MHTLPTRKSLVNNYLAVANRLEPMLGCAFTCDCEVFMNAPQTWYITVIRTFDTREARNAGMEAGSEHMTFIHRLTRDVFARFLTKNPKARAVGPITNLGVALPKRKTYDICGAVIHEEDDAYPKFSFSVSSSCDYEVL